MGKDKIRIRTAQGVFYIEPTNHKFSYNTKQYLEKLFYRYPDKFKPRQFRKFAWFSAKTLTKVYCYGCKKYIEQTPERLLGGKFCKVCAGNVQYTDKQFKEKLKEIYKDKPHLDFSQGIYTKAREPYKMVCKYHGEYIVKYASTLLKGYNCYKCTRKSTAENMNKVMKEKFKNGYKPDRIKMRKTSFKDRLDKEFEFVEPIEVVDQYYATDRVEIRHKKCGSIRTVNLDNCSRLKCFKCHRVGTSKGEQEVAEFLKQYVDIEEHIKPFGDKREIDIYIPSKDLFIEFDGVFWHSDKYKGVKAQQEKTLESLNNGYDIIHITDSQWLNNRSTIKSILLNKLGLTPFKIGARKCTVKEIDYKTARNFVDKNHLQGYARSSIILGLYFEDELLSVMSFSVLKKDYEVNLNRFVNKNFTLVQGGFSKLLRYFIENYKDRYKVITSFADLQWSKGEVYYKNGFRYLYTTVPSYNYYTKTDFKMYHKSYFRKRRLMRILGLKRTNMTEFQMADKLGLIRYYDSGKMKFQLNI